MASKMASRTFLHLSRATSRFLTPTPTATNMRAAAFITTTRSSSHLRPQPHQRLYSTESSSPSSGVTPPSYLDPSELAIFTKIASALQPTKLEVQDISGGCGSMYALDIVSEQFKGLSVMKQHRLVNGILGEEIKGWHGVQLKTKAP